MSKRDVTVVWGRFGRTIAGLSLALAACNDHEIAATKVKGEHAKSMREQYQERLAAEPFSKEEILSLFYSGVSPEVVKTLSAQREDGVPRYTWGAIYRYGQSQKTPEKALFCDTFCCGADYAFSGDNIADFASRGIPDEYIRDLWNAFSSNGDCVGGEAIKRAYNLGLTKERAAQLLPLLDNAADLLNWLEKGGTEAEAREYLATGLFTSREMVWFRGVYGNVRFARSLEEMAEREGLPVNGTTAYLYQLLGLPPSALQFRDTDRPNALIIYPRYDPGGAFSTKSGCEFLENILWAYDTRLVVLEQEQDLARVMLPNLSLLVFGGHGDQASLALGEWDEGGEAIDDPFLQITPKVERSWLDVTDDDLRSIISLTRPDATVFLDSCGTAEGGAHQRNFANFIKDLAGDRHVIAAKESYTSDDLVVLQYQPFSARIIKKGRDITYRR